MNIGHDGRSFHNITIKTQKAAIYAGTLIALLGLRICITSACLTHQNRSLQTLRDFGMPISILQPQCPQNIAEA